jgi:glutamine synthetase
VNIRYDDALLAADRVVMFRSLVKQLAHQHGYLATFMAKPFSEETGNGLHIHASVLGPDGRNIFADPAGGKLGSPALAHAVGGLAGSMNDCMAIFAPTANAYKRLRPANYVPMSACWGYNNRTCAFRVPAGSAAATRIEHRVAGADANPYLAMAAVLAGMLHGIETEAKAPPAIDGNAYETEKPSVPKTWAAALECFETSTFVADWLGADFRRVFHAVKEGERRDFDAEVTPLEWRWYLTTV